MLFSLELASRSCFKSVSMYQLLWIVGRESLNTDRDFFLHHRRRRRDGTRFFKLDAIDREFLISKNEDAMSAELAHYGVAAAFNG